MTTIALFLGLALAHQLIQDEPFAEYVGCYEVYKYHGTGDKPRFVPNRLKITANGTSLYFFPDGSKMTGTEFAFCKRGGAGGTCVVDTAYSNVGTQGLSERDEKFYLFSGDACSSPALGRNCGGHIQKIDIKPNAEYLEINMRQIMLEPISHEDYERGTEATVKRMDCKDFWN